MQKIYIFFLATDFKIGKAIRILTHNQYNHVAFSFSPSTQTLYSYARYRYHEPLLSGFGVEYTDRYEQTPGVFVKVCAYPVTDAHYQRIQQRIAYYEALQEKTRYNFFDVLLYPLCHHVKLEYTHTCISFILELLERTDLHTIGQLRKALEDCALYEGPLSEFEQQASRGEIDFFEKRSRRFAWRQSGKVMLQLAAALALVIWRKF